jgi:hypothetical protein
MKLKQLFASFTLSLIILSSVVAQSQDSQDSTKKEQQQKAQEEREKKALALLDAIIREAQLLKLPENRIRIQASAADLLWPRDEKRARALFKEIIIIFGRIAGEIDAGTQRPPAVIFTGETGAHSSAPNPAIMIWMRTQLRQEILQILMRHDAKWAREFSRQSRQPAGATGANLMAGNIETMMDMQLANQVAGSDPKQALEIAQENFDGAFSTGQHESLVNLIQQLQNKDREAASKLAGDFMKKLRSESYASNPGMAGVAMNFLRAVTQGDEEASTQKQPASKNDSPLLDEQSLKELAGVIVTAALKEKATSEDEGSDNEMDLMAVQSVIAQIEKYAPSRAPVLRAKINEFNKSLNPEARAWSEIASKGENATAEDVLSVAARMPADARSELYREAARKAIGKGDIERARQIVNENITNADQRKAMLAEVDRHALAGAATQGKLEDARRMLAHLESAEERAMVLSQLASALAAKGDKKNAIQLIDEARAMAGNQLESVVQVATQLAIARAAASIDGTQSFDVLEGMIDRFNALVEASAVLDGFEGRQQFREGEMILKGAAVVGNMLQYWSNNLQLLARADFDRARMATERFQRSEVQLMVRLSIAEGVLSNKIEGNELRSFIQIMGQH